MEKKQTAVEWFVKKDAELTMDFIESNITKSQFEARKALLVERAKAMEKEQITEAHEQGMICCMVTSYIQECDFEPYSKMYYNETYGGEK